MHGSGVPLLFCCFLYKRQFWLPSVFNLFCWDIRTAVTNTGLKSAASVPPPRKYDKHFLFLCGALICFCSILSSSQQRVWFCWLDISTVGKSLNLVQTETICLMESMSLFIGGKQEEKIVPLVANVYTAKKKYFCSTVLNFYSNYKTVHAVQNTARYIWYSGTCLSHVGVYRDQKKTEAFCAELLSFPINPLCFFVFSGFNVYHPPCRILWWFRLNLKSDVSSRSLFWILVFGSVWREKQ